MPADQRLPEGTDSIIDDNQAPEMPDGTAARFDDFDLDVPAGEGVAGEDRGDTSAGGDRADGDKGASFTIEGIRAAFLDRVEGARGDLSGQAVSFVKAGMDRTSDALEEVVRLMEDAAEEIDGKIGAQYGDYARRAAETLNGFSQSVRDKPAEALVEDAKALVAKSPAAALGIAAAVGFAFTRVVRAALADGGAQAGNDRGGARAA